MTGLTSSEAAKRLKESGPNQIYKPEKISFFGIARHEVTEPMILLLLFVGVIYSVWGKLDDALTIFIVIALLVFAEVFNEFRAKNAIAALQKIAAPRTKVFRDGSITEVDSEQIVMGDVLTLGSGTKIAADSKVIRAIGLQLDESLLTGESFPKEAKEGDPAFAGTIVVAGEGLAEVVKTGEATRLGEIAKTAKTVRPPRTPLQLSMKKLSGQLVYVAAFFSILIPVIGIFRGQDLKTMILTGLSLSFATIPEELPIVITMVLGLGAYTLSKKNFLVKKLNAAETLGNATVIVTDKTGTITESKLKIVKVYPDNMENVIRSAMDSLSEYSSSPIDEEIRQRSKGYVPQPIVRQRNLGDGRKTRSVIRKADGGLELFMSGAPEEVISACGNAVTDFKKELETETQKGRRVIAVAHRSIGANDINRKFTDLESGLEFSGLISFEDPPRSEAKDVIALASRAGIRTIMVTGDHPLTAGFIAGQVGIGDRNVKVVTGEDLDKLNDQQLRAKVKTASVFARTTPEHKYRIVKALQSNGEVVAVTGDGINDTLALKGADIGIAMGIKGTDVAKEAAEVILADDNFSTIARGIFEGRKFFDNLRKGIKYYLSVKVALIMIFLLPVLMNVPMPFSPIQIILLELFMDLAASAGFVREPEEKDIYLRPPRDPKEVIMNAPSTLDVFLKGIVLFVTVMAVYFYARHIGLSTAMTQTYAFSAWIFAHIAMAFVSRSDKQFLYRSGIFSNVIIDLWSVLAIGFLVAAIYIPYLNEQFRLVMISPLILFYIAFFAVVFVGLLELRKLAKKT